MALAIGPQNQPGNQVASNPATLAGASSGGGLLDQTKDRKNSATDPNFGEIMKQFQARYGAKPEKAREIKKTLGKDDFLKIMITQMKNQDPSKPFNADEMAAQMAQYASVEQLQNVNQNIKKLQSDNKTNEQLAMTGMIGKTVTVDRERFPHMQGQNEALTYTLPRDAAQVHLMIVSNTGETVLEKDIGAQKGGEQSFTWDGNKSNTLPAKSGDFFFKIIAQDSRGVTIPTNPKTQGRVIGVSFEGSEPVFLVGDAKNHQKVTMKNIVQIDDAPQAQPAWTNPPVLAMLGQHGGAAPSQAQPVPQGAPNNFFSFKKGEGSQSLDPQALSPEAQHALQAYQAEAQAAARPSTPGQLAGPSAAQLATKGFPNGLSE